MCAILFLLALVHIVENKRLNEVHETKATRIRSASIMVS